MHLLKSLLILVVLSIGFQASAQNVSEGMSLQVIEKYFKTLKKPMLAEIYPGPVVALSKAKEIRRISVKDINNRLFIAQKLCEPSLPLEFPDGSQGVIVCWLRK